MVSYRRDPYLWVHLAGLAALPLLLNICLLGLAVGSPLLPVWLEIGLLVGVGVVPVVWMQWQRPFYIFSLLLVTIRPAELSEERRRILPYFRSFPVKVITAIAPIFLVWVLWQIYSWAPMAANITPLAPYGRGVGLLVAAIAFLASNLFLQVPLSVLRVLLVGEHQLAQTEPVALEAIAKQFTAVGLPVSRILPDIVASPDEGDTTSGEVAQAETSASAPVSEATDTEATDSDREISLPSDLEQTEGIETQLASEEADATPESVADVVQAEATEAKGAEPEVSEPGIESEATELEVIAPSVEEPDVAAVETVSDEAEPDDSAELSESESDDSEGAGVEVVNDDATSEDDPDASLTQASVVEDELIPVEPDAVELATAESNGEADASVIAIDGAAIDIDHTEQDLSQVDAASALSSDSDASPVDDPDIDAASDHKDTDDPEELIIQQQEPADIAVDVSIESESGVEDSAASSVSEDVESQEIN